MKKVVLIGYMGSGKSVVSKKVANEIGILSLELDEMIEKKCQMSIDEIFNSKGELYFRKLEHQLFLELLNNEEKIIISTGGGTPCYYNNHELLNSDGIISIYLKASVETLFERLIHEKSKRPLIANLAENEIKEFIAKHLFDRSFYYNQATYKVSVDGKTINEIVDEVIKILA